MGRKDSKRKKRKPLEEKVEASNNEEKLRSKEENWKDDEWEDDEFW